MSKDENSNKDMDLKDYKDPDGPSLKELNFGLWIAENRKNLRRLLIIVLIIISAILFIYSAYNYFIYFKFNNTTLELANSSIPRSPRKMVTNLKIYSLQIFSGSHSSDLAVRISNPNDKFMADFNYCFRQADKNIVCGQSFIMPSEKKYILALAQIVNTSSGNLKFNIKNISWYRIDAHEIPNWNNFSHNHLNFLITNLKFIPAQANVLSQRIGLNTLEFSIQNQSPYGYYQAPLNLLFFSGGNLVGVNRYFLENFFSGEKKNIKIVWTGNLSMVDQTQIQPDIDLMSHSVYLPYRGIISE